ncbi:MAG: hypothetical protein QNJ75_06600 [Acidimicrobiia bacterium]|nr:hypothetical protein [Acidimicrobiia bacterium]
MIDSSSVAGHHFIASHRRGYDPAEVDAVIKRLVATLRKYEEREEARNSAATVTNISAARSSRPTPVEDSDLARQLSDETIPGLGRAQLMTDEMLAAAREEAEQILETARADAAGLVARRHERSEALITSALSEVKGLRSRSLRETNDYRDATRAEAMSLLHTAELKAEQVIEDARHEAGTLLGRARREHATLERRLAQLRSAIAEIQGQFRYLAETTLEQTEIMASMISLETEPIEEILDEAAPDVVRLTPQKTTIDLTADEPKTERTPGDDRFAVGPGETIYQRRAVLRRRLEEEEVPELETEEPATDPR